MAALSTGIAAALLAAGIAAGGTPADLIAPSGDWCPVIECRITSYCPTCNDGTGHESSSGAYLRTGHAACRWLPVGTIISIEGEEFEIVDTCGTDAIDVFIDDNSGECRCNLNEYRKVAIKKEIKK